MLCNEINSFLREEGLRPEKPDEGMIAFVYNECKYLIHIDYEEVSPMFITMAALFEYPEGYSQKNILFAANELNNINAVKVLCYEDSFAVQTEMYVYKTSAFIEVFYPLLRQIQTVLGLFAEACSKTDTEGIKPSSESSSKKSIASPRTSTSSRNETSKKDQEGIYYNPKVTGQLSNGARIKKVTITDEYTCIEISTNSSSGGTTYDWCNIDASTYIINEDKPFEKLKLIRASGIKIAPEKTYYGGPNRTINFKLYFPPISKETKSISLIEPDSSWCFYGIMLHK
jgi:hypothetical protein